MLPQLYPLLMFAAIATGAMLFYRAARPLGVSDRQITGMAVGAICGSLLGAKLPFVLTYWSGWFGGTAWICNGKTIMAGVVGGYLGAQLAEWIMRIRVPVCDAFAAPVAVAVGIGRLGCFVGGCCYGTATALPWGFDFGDGVARHPTQLYEAAFHFTAAIVLGWLYRREKFPGQLMRYYFLAYFVYRFSTEFIRPEPPFWLGLTAYQWAALGLLALFALWRCPMCRETPLDFGCVGRGRSTAINARDAAAGAGGNSSDRGVLATTRALCPTCRRTLWATIYTEGERVLLRRNCPEHGPAVATLSSNRRHWYLRDEVPHGLPTLSECCSSGAPHRTCIAVLEITSRCDLHCPVCFADAGRRRGEHRPVDELIADVEAFLANRGPLDVIHLSGGEPLLHPDLLAVIDRCKKLPIKYIMINTNGLELARRPELVAELARRKPGFEINLQFDGLNAATYRALRGADLLEKKLAALELLAQHDVPTTLVCTLAAGINTEELGPLLRLGLSHRNVRGLTIQPATYSGRFEPEKEPLERLTLACVVRLLVAQADGLLGDDDFKPLPCSHPNCCGFTFLMRRNGQTTPLASRIDYRRHLSRLADRLTFDLTDAKACCGGKYRPEDFFRVFLKPFMDVWTYEHDRADECCVHLLGRGGEAVSFCRYNTLLRGQAPHETSEAAPPVENTLGENGNGKRDGARQGGPQSLNIVAQGGCHCAAEPSPDEEGATQ